MKRVNLFILAKDEQRVIRALGHLKLIHLEPADTERQAPLREKPDRQEQLEDGRHRMLRIDGLLGALGCDAEGPAVQTPYVPAGEIDTRLRDIEAALDEIRRQTERLDAEGKQLDAMARDLQAFVGLGIPLERINDFSFLHFAIGSLPGTSLAELSEQVGDSVILIPRPAEDQKVQHLVAITSKKGRFALETELERAGFQPEVIGPDRIGLADELIRQASDRGAAVEVQRELAERLRQEKAGQLGPLLRTYRRTVVNEQHIIEAEANFAYTDAACYITGWVPADRVDDMAECVLEATRGRVAMEIEEPPPESEPPSKFQQSPWLRPFSMLVAGYGFPRYREIEPTLFVAISFLLMFGFMFDDLGHGLVLVLAGIIMRLKARKEQTRDVGVLLIACGLSSSVVGALVGSVFGLSPWGHPLPEPVHAIQDSMILAVVFGTVLISLGVVFNIVNRMRNRDFGRAVFHRFGLVGAVMYWAVLWLAVHRLVWPDSELPIGTVVGILVAGAVVLFMREPLLVFLNRHEPKKAESLLAATITAGVELMETFVGYLANSLSFMRLAAYAVAHGALLLATLQMMKTIENIELLGGPLKVLVFVFGNVVIILLEGLIAGIQAMRLEYYEFFGKFFSGEGRAYRPFEAD